MMTIIKKISGVILLLSAPMAHAWTWQDWWYTPNQQGAQLMQKKDYHAALKTFTDPMWKATAAYRAQNYPAAIEAFAKNTSASGFYNQGNALAQLKRYAEALQAYDESLKRVPNDPDTVHNRAIVEELLKKEQSKSDQSKEKSSDQNKSSKDKENKNQSGQDKQEQDKQEQDKQEQDKQEQDKQEQDKQDQDKQDQDKQDQDKQELEASSAADDKLAQDQKEARQQWLNLVPDDPGGLLREKFRRDHWRRMQENQP